MKSKAPILLLVAVLLITGACKKKKIEPPPAKKPKDYTINMRGDRQLVGEESYDCWLCSPSQYSVKPIGYNFKFIVYDDSTFSIDKGIFHYREVNSGYQYMSFETKDNLVGPFAYTYIDYYYLKDSITYHAYQRSSGDSWEEKVHTQ